MPLKRYLVLATVLLFAAGIYLLHQISREDAGGTQPKKAQANLVNQSTLSSLPQKSASSADFTHLEENILPPTNTWFSGVVLQADPKPVYPMPASFLAQTSGFELGLPTVTSTANQISGGHTPGVNLNNSADGFKLSRYDKLSATLSYSKSAASLADVTVTEGSPFVFYYARAEHSVKFSNIANVKERNAQYVSYVRNNKTYVVATKNADLDVANGEITVNLSKNDLLTVYAIDGPVDTLRAYADNRIESVEVQYSSKDKTVQTKYSIKTANGKPTVLAAMPYSGISGKQVTTYSSIWGDMKTFSGTEFIAKVPAVPPSNELDTSVLTPDEKNKVIVSLRKDAEATTIDSEDSYFSGKQLARAANLLSLAKQLDQKDTAASLANILYDAFELRLGTDFLYYDNELKGIAATKAAFGSEDFNDHHFHYGYWLYAASILAKYDDAFRDTYTDEVNLLAADIASPLASKQFPAYRNYDPYAGHSWAAGLAPFSDGNNQESSSEAMHAWNGAALWGKLTKNSELQKVGEWMLANESNTAAKAWRSVDTSNAYLKSYSAPVASLNFGGKRTYDTFFSPDPSAKLGILLIPMDPTMQIFRSDNQAIKSKIDQTIISDNYNDALGDYILMYLSLTDAPKAERLLSNLTKIDDGNSRSYLQAFIFTQ